MRKPICFLLALLLSIPPMASATVHFDDPAPIYPELLPTAADSNIYYETETLPTGQPEDISGEGNAQLAGNNIAWLVDGSTLYLTGQGDMYDFPNGAPWALFKNNLSRVVIGDGITSVGAYSFHDFDNITDVTFGSSIVQIGAGAFYSCGGLTSITLPTTFKKFGADSFRSCTNLKEIHCSGNFPRFDDNCLWDTAATIYYSVNTPWPVSLVEQLETAFHNRIEFRASDGTDPYIPTEPTVATQPTQPVYIPAPTEAPTYPTQPVQTVPTTVPTVPPTVPPTAPPTVPTTQPQTEPTRETFLMATRPTQATRPAEPQRSGSTIIGVLIILVTLTMSATAALLFRVSRASGSRKKRRKRRD